jgi:hypothetical protein
MCYTTRMTSFRSFACVALALLVPACAAGTETETSKADVRSDDFLTSAEQRSLLEAIDRICGDTWCEGDFNFAFHAFSCRKSLARCELKVEYIWSEESDEREIRYPHTCEFDDVTRKDQIVTETNGRLGYTDGLYEQITECLSDGEGDARAYVVEHGGDAALRPPTTGQRRAPTR